MSKVKSPAAKVLTIHTNTRAKRRAHEMARSLKDAVSTACRGKSVAGYALVAWNERGECSVTYDNSLLVVPTGTLPEFIYRKLSEK